MARRGEDSQKVNSTLFYPDDYEEGRADLALVVEASHLELDESGFAFPQPLKIELNVQRSLDSYKLVGVLAGIVVGECCRCLAAAEASFEAELNLLLQRRQVGEEERAALDDDDDIELIDPGVKQLDLQPFLREALILELPMRIYCRDQCKGLCPQCGINLNENVCTCADKHVDPRWAVLEQLKS